MLIPVFVASPGIEPGSGASETLILSIVRRGRKIPKKPPVIISLPSLYQASYIAAKDLNRNGQQNYAKKFSYSD
jgi:hypothetical protein